VQKRYTLKVSEGNLASGAEAWRHGQHLVEKPNITWFGQELFPAEGLLDLSIGRCQVDAGVTKFIQIPLREPVTAETTTKPLFKKKNEGQKIVK
jgi:hypothetical protein